ncbi:hypothetical protein G647_06807 [Cladophialophora carrionii CBS 160.54]|uniref:REJ domain-containing protein n=1 Tax=Cladophialophora carrionii CBS 160.54 TaxID=1279043 RepID=V9D7T5_9EURO|nr:uncharacterized protein G647_06807 [Cladophialophora carrionii CBS 160.54]ETI22731.1 hypothetical protein G647_06807 [Cladophialophora carrionii CBS 160.54]
MPPLELLTLLLAFTRCAVRSAPLQSRDIYNPLDPLKSVASELLSFTTAFSGPDSTGKQSGATPAASLTDTQQSSAASADTSGTQNVLISTGTAQASGSAGTGSITISGTATQLSTGGVSPSASNEPISTTVSAGSATSSPGSNAASSGVVPTTTGSVGASTTGTSPGSGSSSGPGSSSGGSSGAGSGSGSASGSGSDSSSSSAASTSSASLSPGEIAAVVILPVLALFALLFLLVRYNKRVREKYSAWNQARVERAAYRRALDDPVLSFGMRQQNNPGLGMGDVEQLIRPFRPLSFGFSNPRRPFPRQQRKPLEWDPNKVGGDTASAIGMAVPLPAGQHSRSASEVSEDSDIYGGDDRPGSRYQDARSNQVSPDNVIS